MDSNESWQMKDLGDRKKGEQQVEVGWTRLLITAGLATTLGCSLPCGFSIGVINSPAAVIKVFCNETIFTQYGVVLAESTLNVVWSMVVSVFIVGGVTGSLSGAWVANRVGRKGSLISANILSIIAAVLFVTCKSFKSVELLILGRLIVGLSGGLTTSVMPMYLTELAPVHQRGALGVLCPFGLTFGVLFSQIIGLKQILGADNHWHILLSFYVVFVILSSAVFPFLPESPKYLYVIRNQPELAVQELTRLRNQTSEELRDEIEALNDSRELEMQAGVAWSIPRLLRDPSLRLPIMLVCALQAGQQCSGINAVFYYSVSTFRSAGLSEEGSRLANIGAGVINFVVAIVAIPLMLRTGRRTLAQISCLTSAVCLMVLAISGIFDDATPWMPYVCIVATLAYVFCYGLGLGPIPYFIGSELFEVGPRPAAMALGSMSNWAGNFLVGMSFPSLQNAIGASAFFIFSSVCLLLFVFLRIYLPETRGREIGDIVKMCSQGLRSRPLHGLPVQNF